MVTMNKEAPTPHERKKVEKFYRVDRLNDQERIDHGIFEVYAIVWFETPDRTVWKHEIPMEQVLKAVNSEEKYLRIYDSVFYSPKKKYTSKIYKAGTVFSDIVEDLWDHVTLSIHKGLEVVSEDTLWADWEALMWKADKGSDLAKEFSKYRWLRRELLQSRKEAAQACGFTGPDFRKWRK